MSGSTFKMEVLLMLLLGIIAMTTGSNIYIVDKFEVDSTKGAFSHMVVNKKTGDVYIGAMNNLYQLFSNLTLKTSRETGPRNDNLICPPQYGTAPCDQPQKPMNSYNKALVIDYNNNILIACTSLYHGICERYNLSNINFMSADIRTLVVANNATSTTVAFIAPGPTDTVLESYVLYVAASRTNAGLFRDLIPAITSRRLDNFEVFYRGIGTSSSKSIEATLRDTFPVYYIYGFSSDKFSYFVSVQKQSTISESYISKLIRVCQADRDYYSYAEVPIKCMHNGAIYNLVQAAYVAKAGSSLARTMGISESEDVLYVVSSIGNPNTAIPGSDSALCVYPLSRVRERFTHNIQKCFDGTGNTGPSHIISQSACKRTKFNITDDYCGTYDVNTPIDGTDAIEVAAAITFNSTVSAVAVTTEFQDTIAFVGTVKGHIFKVTIKSGQMATSYDDITVEDGSKIYADMYFDSDRKHLYAFTDRKIYKLKVQECQQYTTCKSCLGANDPYCGWCSLENKCSQRVECERYEQDLRWLSSGHTCTTITHVVPDKIQKEHQKTTQLQLNISHLPTYQGKYECVFSSSTVSIPTQANRTDTRIITCDTPPSNQLPPIPTGEDHIVMQLSVRASGKEFVSTNFIFFDCNLHTSCTSCTLSDFPCIWCINNHMCTSDISGCPDNRLVLGKNVVPMAPSIHNVGPKSCPRIHIIDTEIFVPSETDKKISVSALNLEGFQTSLTCFFNLNNGKQVNAKVTRNPNGESIIECDLIHFSYLGNTSDMKVPFQISWSANKPLDNPEKIQVIMYKCDKMADSCGGCLTLKNQYKCGWCDRYCTINSRCSSMWLPSDATCPNPEITKIEPTSGPKDGGTNLTITGKNLGKEFTEISSSVYLENSGKVHCSPVKELYIAPVQIVCITGASPVTGTGQIAVTINGRYEAKANHIAFSYVNPVLVKITPSRGPKSGGTLVTLSGHDMNAGTKRSVWIGNYSCEVKSFNYTMLTCVTSMAADMMVEKLKAQFDNQLVTSGIDYQYTIDPTITNIDPKVAIVSGGIRIDVTGTHLNIIQDPKMVLYHGDKKYEGSCKVASTSLMHCYSPQVEALISDGNTNSTMEELYSYGFILDNVTEVLKLTDKDKEKFGTFRIVSDPIFESFPSNSEKTYQSKTDNYLIINAKFLSGVSERDVTVRIGNGFCNETSVAKFQVTCKPPKEQPKSLQGSANPEVIVYVGRNFSKLVGYLRYDQQEVPLPIIIGVPVGVVVLVIIFFVVILVIKKRENKSMKKKWQIQMDNLESKVAKECKEAFAELQTDMTELHSDYSGQVAIPYWDYQTYCMRVLFPQDEAQNHPVIHDLNVDHSRREEVERGLKQFAQLLNNKTFLLTMIQTLELNKKFSMRDRVNVASLISVALQTKLEYATDILKTLLADLIERSVDGKNHPKLLLRRTESVAEKMLTNWFTFLLYKFLRECAGEPLFMLYQAMKQQVGKGPVDTITSEARYSLSEDKLIRQQVEFKPMTIYVQDINVDQYTRTPHPVKVLDCDSISQVKEKILDAIYKNAPFSSRPVKEDIDLAMFDQTPDWDQNSRIKKPLILSDDDITTKVEGEYRRLNSLSHYKVPDGACMALVPKPTPSVVNLTITSEKSDRLKLYDYQKLDNSVYFSANTRSPSLNRTVSPQGVQIDMVEHLGVKCYHLVKPHDSEANEKGDRGSKMVSEIYLTRLLATKGTLQQYVDDLFERIFSTVHRGTVLPLAIKYMFDFLDDQALLHNIQDPEVVHTWKSNSLPLRFWVNLIKNPNFVFDIYKSNIVDSCLSVVAQNFMDSCSTSEIHLTKDSPSSKLLYAKDIPTYKKWVERYYQDIKMMPAISDQDMTAMLTEESRVHQDEFNTNASLLELYKYVEEYYDEIVEALEQNEFAKNYRLTSKLENVRVAMNREAYC
ncbi:hypothetical protein ACJMK2_017198 [Sinanodonta woodiana]|uniref:Sema domain-containing protein n=1 Tax=Sinanodonta woodiana TaxID=1069815 RepID=A0ABD3UZH1_SINWO